MRVLLLCSVLLIAGACEGFAGDPVKKPSEIFNTDLSGGDLQFLNSAAVQGMVQVALGSLGADHAQSSEVKDFAQTIAQHHAGQNEQIKLIAMKKGVLIPSSLSPKQNAVADRLSRLQGLKFDKAYMEEMINQQQAYEVIFEQATQSRDDDIKSFAVAELPAIKEHLALVRNITGIAPVSAGAPHFRIGIPGPSSTDKKKD